VAPGNVVILGGGIVGTNAAKIAVGMGAHVTIIDRSLNRLRELDDIFTQHVVTLASNAWTISENLKTADLVVGAVLIPGASAPRLVKREMIANMKRGAVVVDVAIDQGGCFETSHATTHTEPIYFRGWRAALLRFQYAGGGALHVHDRPHQRDVPVPVGTGEPWAGRRLRTSRRAVRRRQYLQRLRDLPRRR
jgi:threonine dehydrogenase-like Zn-dependent dehydrogenase